MRLGKEGVPETVIPKISQETLADMVVAGCRLVKLALLMPYLMINKSVAKVTLTTTLRLWDQENKNELSLIR